MNSDASAVRLLRRVAALCVFAMAATVLLSAYLRLKQAGIDCADWPACYGLPLREGKPPPLPGAAVAAARLAHRIVATVVLIGAFVIAMTAFARSELRSERVAAAALVVLALALAALGVVTPGSTRPAVTIGNLVGGFAMLALCVRLAFGDAGNRGLGAWATVAAAALVVQAALGAQVSASAAGLACDGLTDCLRAAAAGDWSSLDPFRPPAFAAGDGAHRAAAPLLLAHRAGAIGVALVTIGAAARAWRRQRHADAIALGTLLVAEWLVGPGIGTGTAPLGLALLHNALAAALLAVLVRIR